MDLLVARLLYFVKIPVKWGGGSRKTFKISSAFSINFRKFLEPNLL
jgi:hypothetical protein